MTPPAGRRAARAAAAVDAVAAPLCRGLTALAAACLAVMVVLTVLDVAGRYLLNRPLPGTLELSEFAMAVLVFLGLGATGRTDSQVVVDIALERVPGRARAASQAAGALLGVVLWALIAWRSLEQAGEVWLKGEVSTILALPASPFVFAVALGSAVMALALLGRLLDALARTVAR
ncbi:MAG TPA: TRAP transporter small permease [Methylomirabilota bacterium]|nr:TRAP transporter small permease [Methylomirabilota bacterium]